VLGDGELVFAQVPDLSNALLSLGGVSGTQTKMRKIRAGNRLMAYDYSPRWRLRFSQTLHRS